MIVSPVQWFILEPTTWPTPFVTFQKPGITKVFDPDNRTHLIEKQDLIPKEYPKWGGENNRSS